MQPVLLNLNLCPVFEHTYPSYEKEQEQVIIQRKVGIVHYRLYRPNLYWDKTLTNSEQK